MIPLMSSLYTPKQATCEASQKHRQFQDAATCHTISQGLLHVALKMVEVFPPLITACCSKLLPLTLQATLITESVVVLKVFSLPWTPYQAPLCGFCFSSINYLSPNLFMPHYITSKAFDWSRRGV